jgi:putative flippase GtrA
MRQFITYAFCGGFGVLTDIALFAALVHVGVGYQVANLASYAAGTLVSFVLNRLITFKVKDRTAQRMGLFFMVAAIGYVLSTGALWLMVEQFGLAPLVAKVLTLFIVLVVQFSLNRAITFRATHEPA